MKRLLRDRDGAAAVEFALVLPLLMTLVFGVFEFGMLWNSYQIITDAAREGARRAVVANPALASTPAETFATIEAAIRRARPGVQVVTQNAVFCDATLPNADLAHDVVEIYGCRWDGSSGDPARVAIRFGYEFGILAPFLEWTTDQRGIVLTTDFWMRNE